MSVRLPVMQCCVDQGRLLLRQYMPHYTTTTTIMTSNYSTTHGPQSLLFVPTQSCTLLYPRIVFLSSKSMSMFFSFSFFYAILNTLYRVRQWLEMTSLLEQQCYHGESCLVRSTNLGGRKQKKADQFLLFYGPLKMPSNRTLWPLIQSIIKSLHESNDGAVCFVRKSLLTIEIFLGIVRRQIC